MKRSGTIRRSKGNLSTFRTFVERSFVNWKIGLKRKPAFKRRRQQRRTVIILLVKMRYSSFYQELKTFDKGDNNKMHFKARFI